MPRITNLHKEWWFAAIVLGGCVWYLWRGPRRPRMWLLCAVIAVGISDPLARRVIKELFPRERPCQGVSLLTSSARLVPGEECPGSPSFPSNHASNMAALAVVCWWFTRRRIRWLWFLLPFIIGYSRIYLGYHYPTDVMGGWVIGASVGAAVLFAFRSLLRESVSEESGTSSGRNSEPDSSGIGLPQNDVKDNVKDHVEDDDG